MPPALFDYVAEPSEYLLTDQVNLLDEQLLKDASLSMTTEHSAQWTSFLKILISVVIFAETETKHWQYICFNYITIIILHN